MFPVKLRYAEALWVRYALQKNLGAAALFAIRVRGRSNVSLNDIVTQYDANRVIAGEVFDQRQGGRDAALAFLISIVEMF